MHPLYILNNYITSFTMSFQAFFQTGGTKVVLKVEGLISIHFHSLSIRQLGAVMTDLF